MKTKSEKEVKIPDWSLPYLINNDPSGLSEEEVNIIDGWYASNVFTGYTMFTFKEDQEPYFSNNPAFGLPCNVIDCMAITLV